MKVMNREFRKLSNLPYGICTTPCACCKKLEKKKHECTHEFCEPNCSKKKLEQLNLFKDGQFGFHNFLSQQLKKKIASGNKSQIFGVINKEETKPNGTSK